MARRGFHLPLCPQLVSLVPLALALNSVCSSTVASKTGMWLVFLEGRHVVYTLTSSWELFWFWSQRTLVPILTLSFTLHVTFGKLLSLFKPRLPHLLIDHSTKVNGIFIHQQSTRGKYSFQKETIYDNNRNSKRTNLEQPLVIFTI